MSRFVEFDLFTPRARPVEVEVPHDLLDQIADQIEAEPQRYDQAHWSRDLDPLYDLGADGEPFCGTAYCIGGWATTLAGLKVGRGGDVWAGPDRVLDNIEMVTAALLNLSDGGAAMLTSGGWHPNDYDVPNALRRLQKRSLEVDMLTSSDVWAVTEGRDFDDEDERDPDCR